MYIGPRNQVGRLSVLCRVFLKQQFPGQLKESPYEAMYGQKCRTPLNWSQTGRIFGTDLMLKAEKQVKEIRDRLQLAKSRQKSYYDAKHRQISFEPGEHVYLRVTPMKGIKRFRLGASWHPDTLAHSQS